jgi:general stress protein CsbA
MRAVKWAQASTINTRSKNQWLITLDVFCRLIALKIIRETKIVE